MIGDICHFVSSFNFISQKNNGRDKTIFKKLNIAKLNWLRNIIQLHLFLQFIFTFILSNTFFIFYFYIENSKYQKKS